jgi:hypothetical protein
MPAMKTSVRTASLFSLAACAGTLVACTTVVEDTTTGTPTSVPDDIADALAALPEAKVIEFTSDGVPTFIVGELAQVGALPADPLAAEVALRPALDPVVAPFRLEPHELDGTDFAGIDIVERRLDRLRRGFAAYRGKAELRPTSARWAWVEYMLAQGDQRAGLAVLDAHTAGGSFAAYKKAFTARGASPTGPRARVPSSAEIIALRKRGAASSSPPG